ncbi:MAG: type I restriction enzyme HsdR N-terminal domain-containing protein [Chitinophagaceae bacterium]
MLNIQFPRPDFQIRTQDGREMIFDRWRKKWLLLTPEEWVRQNFVQFLINTQQYPPTLIALEKQIRLGERLKRFDVLVYNPDHQPWMLVECKAPTVALSAESLQQVLRYHISLPASFLVLTNGQQTLGWQKQEGKLLLLETMPAFPY